MKEDILNLLSELKEMLQVACDDEVSTIRTEEVKEIRELQQLYKENEIDDEDYNESVRYVRNKSYNKMSKLSYYETFLDQIEVFEKRFRRTQR